ncbi:hypothetical protein DH2020_041516 [Rehmannia glutinosa]|uniref:DUF4283 domain-containing protein n=1 Tax=Rehmannia glutinosa TaxID=99300 RepID=A0ABR0US12_REHGL
MPGDISSLCSKLSLDDDEKIQISVESLDLENLDESLSLVGRVLANRVINFDSIADLYKRLWNPRDGLICKLLAENTVLFQFRNLIDRQKVINGSPWLFDKFLHALSDMNVSQIGSKLDITSCPFWVRLHDVPIGLINKSFATEAGNIIGKFITVDTDSDGLSIGRFLRIRVDINISKPLRRSVTVIPVSSIPPLALPPPTAHGSGLLCQAAHSR